MDRDLDKPTEQLAHDAAAHESLDALFAAVTQELRNIDITYQGTTPLTRYGGYHRSAAVLSTYEISGIKPDSSSSDVEKIEDLLADSVLVYDEPKPRSETPVGSSDSKEKDESLPDAPGERPSRWTLLPDVRRRVIEQMGTREAFRMALEANPQRGKDAMQRMIEGYVLNTPKPLASQTVEELTCTAQVVEWFQGCLNNLPEQQVVAQRLDAKRLLQPFEKLVGEHFRGREDQLDKLRQYVGVLKPGSWFGQLRLSTEKFLNFKQKPPLMIYGPGGVGKSTLVAKFILEHATLSTAQRFPYAYLDFDRPGLLAEEPATLLVEAVRQLGIQYPDVREHSERVRRDWQEELGLVARQAKNLRPNEASRDSIKLSKQQRTSFLTDFEALLVSMGLSDEPFLLVLDTFEEVQYRSHQYINQLWEALEELQSIVPRLRTVFSGRSPLTGFNTQEVPLNDLDAAAAKGFLTAMKIQPESLVDTIVKRVGGNPMSLRLAVQVFHNERGASKDFFDKLKKGRIQTELYNRVLEHIHEKDVKKLAHPGLILRRITPGLILKVLAEPCEVKVENLEEADKLFDSLSKEVTLVVSGGTTQQEPRALRHTPEVRRGMIQLLREDEDQKPKILAIQRNAIAYYEPFNDPVQRTEEIYHRLMLKQDHAVIAKRWMAGVRDNLFNTVEEFEPPEQAFLAARLDLDVDDSVLAQATARDWEVIVGRRASNFLKLGQPENVLAAIGQRKDLLPGSYLYLLEAQANDQQGKLSEARAAVARGLQSVIEANAVTFDMFMLAGRLDLRMQRYEDAFSNWYKARALALSSSDDIRLLEANLELLRPGLTHSLSAHLSADLSNETRQLLQRIPDASLAGNLALFRNAVDRFGTEDTALLARGVRLVGFELANQTQLRSLARAIAEWEFDVSSATNLGPGLLARMAKIPMQSELVDTWKTFIQTSNAKQVEDVVSLLVSNYSMSANVRDALLDILKTPLSSGATSETPSPLDPGISRASSMPSAVSVLNVTPDERQSLIYALKSAFPNRANLAQMLWFRMNLNLDSISLTDTLEATVEYAVRYAERRGLLVQLVTAARASSPGNLYLANFARKFGMTPDAEVSDDALASIVRSQSSLSTDLWRAAVGEISGRVCRVEVGAADTVSYGGGVLVAPNILLTSYQTLEPVISGKITPQDVALRFDLLVYSGTTIHPGTVYRLEKQNWLMGYSPASTSAVDDRNLNFALVQLEGVPGREPLGGENAEPGAPPRGWINIQPSEAMQAPPPVGVIILHYPAGESLKLSLNTDTPIQNDEKGTRVTYTLDADDVSSGAPCFNHNWELVGLHSGKVPGSSSTYAVRLSAIIAYLQDSGFDVVGRDKFEATVLRGGRVFLNRASLRQALREMSAPTGRRVLVVTGPPGSGKTYTMEYILDVTYRTPNHHVIYIDLDAGNYSAGDLAEMIAHQINSDLLLPAKQDENEARWVNQLSNLLISKITTNSVTKWWFVLDGFTRPIQPSTRMLIELLAAKSQDSDLRLVLLNYEFDLKSDVNNRVIKDAIAPITRTDVEAFILQQLQQRDPDISHETVNGIVDNLLAAPEETSGKDIYPTADRLRALNRAIRAVIQT